MTEAQVAAREGVVADLGEPTSPVTREATADFRHEGQVLTHELVDEAVPGAPLDAIGRTIREDALARLDASESARAAVQVLARLEPEALERTLTNLGLASFIRRAGGIRDIDRLAEEGVTARTRPGLVRLAGLSIEEATDVARREGFRFETPDELVRAISDDIDAGELRQGLAEAGIDVSRPREAAAQIRQLADRDHQAGSGRGGKCQVI